MAIASTPTPEKTERQLSLPPASKHAAWIAVTVLVMAAFAPLLWTHFQQLWARPHYQFFPLVFVGAGVLAWANLGKVTSLQPGTSWIAWCLMAWSWCMLAGAELLPSSWLGAVAFLFLVLAAIYAAGGTSLLRSLMPAWLYLWLIIPPPLNLDQYLVSELQLLTTKWSSAVLDLFRVFHVIAGNVVEIGDHRFFVDEACTGINSLFSILACTLFYVLFTRPSLARAIFLVLAAIAWVLLANVARVFLVVYLAKFDLAEGWRHDLLGFALFAVALVMIWSTDRLLMTFTPTRKKINLPTVTPAAAKVSREERGVDFASHLTNTWMNSWLAGAVFALLLSAHVFLYTIPDASAALSASAHAPDPNQLQKTSLPAQIDGWNQTTFAEPPRRNPGSAYGEYSKMWTYDAAPHTATFSVDYPFGIWHELQECYRNQGWEVEETADLDSKDEGTPAFYSTRKLTKTGHRTGYLFFCEFDQAGRGIKPARLASSIARHESALRRLQNWGGRTLDEDQPQAGTLFQFQMLLKCNSPLSTAEIAKARDRFFVAYRALHGQMFETTGSR